METEIELKFFVSSDFSDILKAKIADSKVLQHGCRHLGNIYFDTPDQQLRQHDIGLRIRRFDDVFVQTLKTAGRVVAGLHQRPEYNAEHDSNNPNLALHPIDAWPEGLDVEQVQNTLQPLFSTNFTREQWLIGMPDGSQVELAFDQGEVVSGDKRDPICEVELELKSGQTEALFSLARTLAEEGGMRLGNLSKAAKGYRLATGYQGDQIKPLSIVKTHDGDSVEHCFVRSLEHALAHWHYHEQIYVERPEPLALKEICNAISFIRQILTVFGGVIPRRASAIIRQELKWLAQELDWLNDAKYIEALTADKGQVLRKLNARKVLLNELKAKYDVLPEREDSLMLLQSSRYCGLLLDLSRWILARGWQPFLDDKSRSKMAGSINDYSIKLLDKTWAELMEAFPAERQLSRQDYFDQQPRLNRSLMTGICFASLYDETKRHSFRLPWEDLVQGIDDLKMLEPLRVLVAQLEGDDQKQLERWLERQEHSILHAMDQTRQMGIEIPPYWA